MEVLQRTANRGSISTGGYEVDNSLKLESDNAEYLDNRHHSAGNRRTWTLSFWIKRTELGTTQKPYDAGNAASIAFLSTDKIQIENSNLYLVTDRVFRDTSAWYHIVQLNDSTQSTASNRAKLWINGVQETSFSSETYMAQNQEGNMNSATSISIGGGGGAHVNGYMAELFFVDGQALAPTDFGEFDDDTGIWIPKEYEGTLSGTSIKLDFSDSSALWTDSSGLTGNGTSMSGNNITAADQATDTPTNNFAIINAINLSGTGITLSNGATKMTNGSTWQTGVSTIAVTKGKWYFEAKASSASSFVGFVDVEDAYVPQNSTGYFLGYAGGNQNRSVAMGGDGNIYNDNNSASGTSFGSSNIVGMALDMDNRKVYWYVDNSIVNSGNAVTWATSSTLGDAWTDVITLAVSLYSGVTMEVNFGGFTTMSISSPASDANGYGTFEYAPPTGYYALCTKNLAEFG